MAEHHTLARKYRPQSFKEVIGQDATITTLKNAIKRNRLAHAYLFSGSRGTGKTTIARVFAKALNCQAPLEDLEPCNSCSSCREISQGSSLDVLEIDGASHRGIDDVRQINETVGYAASSGKYKIYIIDEAHMLTKEAFNALLKTLEEPPLKVKFFFATTEPHKMLPTILSRCQRFNLNRIPTEKIVEKLQRITEEMSVSIEESALRLLAHRAEGGLRDAESLLDQMIAFHEGEIRLETAASVLGVVPSERLFALDEAGKEGNFKIAFDIVHEIFSQGKDLTYFLENLIEHFRNILLTKASSKGDSLLSLAEWKKYEESAKLYSLEQCMTILDFLLEAQDRIRFAPSAKIALEALLLKILRIRQRAPIDVLVRRLSALEQNLAKREGGASTLLSVPTPSPDVTPLPEQPPAQPPKPPAFPPQPETPPPVGVKRSSLTEDPAPTKADLMPAFKEAKREKPVESVKPIIPPEKQSRYDTILQFAAVELEGSIQKKNLN